MKKIKVLIVDDSAIVRKVFKDYLNSINDIEVVGVAADPYVARDLILQLKPDVITLDIEMPKMDGLTFLKKLMKFYPLPIIMVSSLLKDNNSIVLKALESGAFDVVAKPSAQFSIHDILPDLVSKIRNASFVDIKKMLKIISAKNSKNTQLSLINKTKKIIAIGASTGGTKATRVLLKNFPKNSPPIVIVQHMPPLFTKSYAESLNSECVISVKEAEDGEPLLAGTAYLAPGDKHLLVVFKDGRYYAKLSAGPKMFYQRPAVEVLFTSVAKNVGKNAIGVILTGMGKDGASALLEMKEAGSITIAQDEETSIVWGMPGEAVKIGAADLVLALEKIADKVIDILNG